jgi:hypothetical protein
MSKINFREIFGASERYEGYGARPYPTTSALGPLFIALVVVIVAVALLLA